MDLLAGYGSDSGSEPSLSPLNTVEKRQHGPPSPPAQSHPSQQQEKIGAALSSLPLPSSDQSAYFSGLPTKAAVAPVFKRRKIVAKFSCPIDYGKDNGLQQMDDDEKNDDHKFKARIKQGQGMRLNDFLPPPKHTTTRTKLDGATGDKGGELDEDDIDIVPGAEDPTGMYLGAGIGDIEDEGDDYVVETTAPGATVLSGSGGGGGAVDESYAYQHPPYGHQHQHQHQYQEMNHSIATDVHQGAVIDNVETSGIQFKEISGAQLRYMAPGQRAELTALRSALGDDYEARLKAEAAKVGSVSKLAKRKHQLTSLYVQSKEQELEDMEKKGGGMRKRSETIRKYGW